MNYTKKILVLIIPLIVLVFVGAGCFKRAAETSVENTINARTGGEGEIDITDDTYNYEDKETGARASVGEDARIPDDFPSDVPRYWNAKILAATVMPNQEATLLYMTDDEPSQVMQWYKDEFSSKQWEQQSDSNFNGRLMRVYQKDDVMISIAVSEANGNTSVTVIRAIK